MASLLQTPGPSLWFLSASPGNAVSNFAPFAPAPEIGAASDYASQRAAHQLPVGRFRLVASGWRLAGWRSSRQCGLSSRLHAMDPACWLIGGEFEDSWFDEETESSDDVEVLTVKKFRGDLAYRRQEYQKALQEYSSISEKLSSTNFAMKRDVQEGQARCLAHLGRHTEALEIATNLENKATNTDHLSTVLYLQFAICSSWPNLERTISCLQKLIALHPFDPWTWSKLAEAYLSLGPAPSASVASPQGHDGFLSSDEAVKSAFPHLGRDCLLCLPELLPQSSVFSIKARSSNGQKYENTLKSIPSCMAEKREAVLPETLVKACASLIRARLEKCDPSCGAVEIAGQGDAGKWHVEAGTPVRSSGVLMAATGWECVDDGGREKEETLRVCPECVSLVPGAVSHIALWKLLLQLTESQQTSFALEKNLRTQQEIEDRMKGFHFPEDTLLRVTEVMGEDIVPEKMKEGVHAAVKGTGVVGLAGLVTASVEGFEDKWFGKLRGHFCSLESHFHTEKRVLA
ncbi:hypothetical protein H920_18205 [Fukomys damarensis]|uniref:Zinc fingers and homeoboxes protein 1 n=1 Tax=Fukomys damarensis TaxID=885580 RepID=A0A091CNC9_FUKDA|nr:hypothetical protein H920_18205 [Fukomys damarensis]